MPCLRAVPLLALALCGLCIVGGACAAVVLVDSAQNAYLHGGRHDMTPEQLHGTVAALTGLQPAVRIAADVGKQIDSVVRPSPLKKPRAYLSCNLVGVRQEDLSDVFGERTQVQAPLHGQEQQAAELFVSLARANPAVRFHLVEHLAAEGCQDDEQCVTQLLPEVADAVGAAFQGGRVVLQGSMQLDFEGSEADRVFATELASVVAGVKALARQADQGEQQDIVVADMTLTGLGGLAQAYGDAVPKLTAAKDAVKRLLTWTTQQLDSLFDGDVAIQVVLLDGEGSTPLTVDDSTAWKQERRSRLLQETASTDDWPPANPVAAAKKYSAKAAAYGAFIILLYFSIAAAYCLCNMPFKKDSLLYGSKKTD